MRLSITSRTIAAALVTTGLSIVFSSCGNNQQPAPPQQTATTPAAEPSPNAPPPAAAAPEQTSPASRPAPETTTSKNASRPAPPAQSGSASRAPAPQPSAPPVSSPAAAPAPAPEPAPAPPPPPPPRVYTLKAGMPIAVYTTTAISTATHATGDTFSATLSKPITDGDWLIAKEGARVQGVVVNSDPGGRVKGVASMELGLRTLTLADGRTLDLQTNSVSQEAATSKKKDAKKIGIGAGVGAAIGAIAGGGKGAAIGTAVGGGAGTAAALSTRGDAAEVPSETLLNFSLEKSVSVTEKPKSDQ